jgi:uncharacterized membrane protein YfcA
MIRQFAKRSPRAATGLIYAAGSTAGTLFGFLLGYLISGAWKPGAMAIGIGCGVLALRFAQRRGIVPEPEELNKAISLFGPEGFRDVGRQ